MRRNGFTMVELIFVIIIIGILSVAAIPKFGDIKDRAKVNSEVNALASLDGAIEGAIAFQQEDYNNMGVLWHNQTEATGNDSANEYKSLNDNKKVLSKILKKGEDLKVVKFLDMGKNATSSGVDADNNLTYDVIFLEGVASNHITGVKSTTDTTGKPDKNDVWVFNTSPIDVTIGTHDGTSVVKTTVESGTLKLIDIVAPTTTAANYTGNVAPDSNDDIAVSIDGGTNYSNVVSVP